MPLKLRKITIELTLLVVVLAVIADGVYGLRGVYVTVPQAARIMDTVSLQCRYDAEGMPLYTVKWYKGSTEFFRYIPKEHPSTQVFPLLGIDVDVSKSNENEVVLRNVQPECTGKYSCEVTTDAPDFDTKVVSGYLFIIDVPKENPVLTVEKDILEIGYTIRGNCTTPPSFPALNVTWVLNGKTINETHLKRIAVETKDAVAVAKKRVPVVTYSTLELEIDSNTFQGGQARLTCVAKLFNLYLWEKEVVLEEERPRPRPSSVLGNRAASGSAVLTAGFFLNVLVLTLVLR